MTRTLGPGVERPLPTGQEGRDLPPPPAPRWALRPAGDAELVARLSQALGLPSAICELLVVRGVTEVEAAKAFLRPRLEDLHPPAKLAGSGEAVRRISAAIRGAETIFVHGDYDVDGISAATLLTVWLRRLGGTVVPFVPHRITDGYDFGPGGLAAATAVGATLIVTADCGIVAHETVSEAMRGGIDVVVTDHHTPGDTLPPALAVVNPNRADCDYPFGGLSGTGVVFKLCQLLADAFAVSRDELLPHLDLVALASIADLVPLEDENRILVRFGLRALRQTEKPGLRALVRATGLKEGAIDAGTVGFVLAPPINAAGRIADAKRGLDLLLSASEATADPIADELTALNRDRREEDRRIFEQALDALSGAYDPGRDFGVVVAGEGWHPGVIGIVASRVVERLHRPVVVISMDGDSGRGSARSIPGFDLYEAIHACGHLLSRFGGHRQAAGLELSRENLAAFRHEFNAHTFSALNGEPPSKVRTADLVIELADVTSDFHKFLEYVGPFGIGNPRPLFRASGLSIAEPPRVVGTGHLKLVLSQGRTRLEAIGFGLAERVPPGHLGTGPLDALFQVRENTYRGRTSVQLRLVDVHRSKESSAE